MANTRTTKTGARKKDEKKLAKVTEKAGKGGSVSVSSANEASTAPEPETSSGRGEKVSTGEKVAALAEKPGPKSGSPMVSAKSIPGPSEIRAHPDANLTEQELQVLYRKLIEERNRVLSGFDRHVSEALQDDDPLADEIDIAQRYTDQAWLFRFADKERKLLIEIDAALEKMRTGEYGICEGTEEPIGYKRLELRPWTRYSVGYKELLEREKAQHTR